MAADLIPVASPKGAGVAVVKVGRHASTLTFDAAGWRALHAALGLSPPPEFVPHARTCLRCGRDEHTVKHWAAANLCMACMPLAARPQGDHQP